MDDIDERSAPPVTDDQYLPFYNPENPPEDGFVNTQLALEKKLVRAGEGWDSPDEGDEVTVHYRVDVDGYQVASTENDEKPMVVCIGQDNILKGCMDGIMTMKKGEVSIFTLPPKAWNASKHLYPCIIGDGATLQFEVEMLSWFKMVDVCNDGGIMKKILVKSEILDRPEKKDEVKVRYEVKLENGDVVAKSSDDGVEFLAEDGHLCPAIANTVVTMRKGEKALLRVLPKYAFGSQGRKATGGYSAVPRNAVITISLELVAYKLLEHVTDDKKVIKKIINTGKGFLKPNTGTKAQIRYIAKLSNGTISEKQGYDGEAPFEFSVDEDEVLSGLDLAVATMRKGEIALLIVNPSYGFGNIEMKTKLAVVPPLSTLHYEVEMVEFTKVKESWDMEPDERIAHAKKRKEEGNSYFKAENYVRASLRYDLAAKYVEFDSTFDHEQKKIGKFFRVTCLLNDAACKIKLNQFTEGAKLCTKVLQLEPSNVKALYRRAQCYMETNDLELAETDLLIGKEIEPYNGQFKLLHEKVKQLKSQVNKMDKTFYGNMLSKFGVSNFKISLQPCCC